jgi:membrane-associated phospholipid phosphatase
MERVAARAARTAETAALASLRPGHRTGRRAAAGISDAARCGRLWIGLSVAGALSPRTRRAAGHGLVAWAVASGSALGVKQVTDRDRPKIPGLGAAPTSTSMPSSHTAAAVAYAVAAAWRQPAVGLVVAPAAAAVGWSRTATGRHFPTDVAVGAALGAVVGTAVHVIGRRSERARSAQSSDGDERALPTSEPGSDVEQLSAGE